MRKISFLFYYIFFQLNLSADALQRNQDLEFERNLERFQFLKVAFNFQLAC